MDDHEYLDRKFEAANKSRDEGFKAVHERCDRQDRQLGAFEKALTSHGIAIGDWQKEEVKMDDNKKWGIRLVAGAALAWAVTELTKWWGKQ